MPILSRLQLYRKWHGHAAVGTVGGSTPTVFWQLYEFSDRSRWSKPEADQEHRKITRKRLKFLVFLVRMGPWSPQAPTVGPGGFRNPSGPKKQRIQTTFGWVLGMLGRASSFLAIGRGQQMLASRQQVASQQPQPHLRRNRN